jgi:hypothetical protein
VTETRKQTLFWRPISVADPYFCSIFGFSDNLCFQIEQILPFAAMVYVSRLLWEA